MPHVNEVLVRSWFVAQARGDEAAVRAALADDVVWHVPGRSPLSADYRGPDEVLAFLARPRELSNGTVRPQILDVMAGDDYAIALVRVHAEREGKKLDGSLRLDVPHRGGPDRRVLVPRRRPLRGRCVLVVSAASSGTEAHNAAGIIRPWLYSRGTNRDLRFRVSLAA